MTLTDTQLDQTLRSADPAQPELTSDQIIAKDALLERILATDVATGATRASLPRAVRRRRTLRWAVPGVALACVVGGSVGLSVHGATDANAWTPTPQTVDAKLVATVRDACAQKLQRYADEAAAHGQRSGTDFKTLHVVLTERRGRYVLVGLSDAASTTVTCIANRDRPQETWPTGMGGPPGMVRPALQPTEFRVLTQGWQNHMEGISDMGVALGDVGSDVRKVTIHEGGVTLDTTVANGYFGGWWPAVIPKTEGNPPKPPAFDPITYDLTLANGKVLYAQQPVRWP